MNSLFDTTNLNIDAIKESLKQYTSDNDIKLCVNEIWNLEPAAISANFGKIAGGTNGNYIAYTKPPAFSSNKHAIDIYNHELHLIQTIMNTDTCNNVYMHFDLAGHLFFFAANGITNTITEYFNSKTISTYEFTTNSYIVYCQMWDHGCVCINSDLKVYYVHKYSKEEYLFDIPRLEGLEFFAVADPNYSITGKPIVYSGGGTKLQCTTIEGTVSLDLPKKVTHLSLSPLYEYLSIGLSDDESLSFCVLSDCIILSANLSEQILQIKVDLKDVTYLGWLGDAIPVLISDSNLYIYDRYGVSTMVSVGPSPVYINCDTYALVFGRDTLMIVNEIGPFTNECFDKTNPSGKLCRAYDERSSVGVNRIKGDLKLAIQGCINAAMECAFDVEKQKYFLACAVFGSYQLENQNDLDNQIDIDGIALNLRICNSLRNDLKICSGYVETERLIKSSLVPLRYAAADQFGRASNICKLIGGRQSMVVTEWCRNIIDDHTIDDSTALRLFRTKIDSGLNPTEVADIARKMNRPDLARSVGLLERFPSRIVNLWVEEGKWEDALQAATDSMDDTILIPLVSQCLASASEDFLMQCFANNKNLYFAIERVFGDDKDNRITQILKKSEVSKETADVTVRRRIRGLNLPAIEQTKRLLTDFKDKFKLPYVDHMITNVDFCNDMYQQIGAEGRGRPFNQAIVDAAMKDINAAIDKCTKELGFSKERSIAIILRGFLNRNEFAKVTRLASEDFKSYHKQIVKTILILKGEQDARDFVNLINDQKRKAACQEIVDTFDRKQWNVVDKDLPQCFFN